MLLTPRSPDLSNLGQQGGQLNNIKGPPGGRGDEGMGRGWASMKKIGHRPVGKGAPCHMSAFLASWEDAGYALAAKYA